MCTLELCEEKCFLLNTCRRNKTHKSAWLVKLSAVRTLTAEQWHFIPDMEPRSPSIKVTNANRLLYAWNFSLIHKTSSFQGKLTEKAAHFTFCHDFFIFPLVSHRSPPGANYWQVSLGLERPWPTLPAGQAECAVREGYVSIRSLTPAAVINSRHRSSSKASDNNLLRKALPGV